MTGGIGSGKSTVSRLLAERGALIIDADRIAREVVRPGTPGLEMIRERFGADVIAEDGTLDRPALGAIVFADETQRKALEAITHPLIRARTVELMEQAPREAIIVHDIPLLVETGAAGSYHAVLAIDVDDEVRIERLMGQRGMAEADARARMASQASRAERLAVADIVLPNNGTLAELDQTVAELWPDLVARNEELLAASD